MSTERESLFVRLLTLHALRAAEAEHDEALRELSEKDAYAIGEYERAEAAEAERDEARQANAEKRELLTKTALRVSQLEAERDRLLEGFEFSCQCGKSYVFPPPSDPRNRDDNPHPDGEEGT